MLHYVDSMILQSASVMHIRKVCAAASRRHPEVVQRCSITAVMRTQESSPRDSIAPDSMPGTPGRRGLAANANGHGADLCVRGILDQGLEPRSWA